MAHIASGQGRARRVDDRRAVVVLCPLVHRVHVSDSDAHPEMHVAGQLLPTIDERHTLWVKRAFDPEWYDEEFLSTVWVGNLPEPQRPPEYWMRQLFTNQGVLF